VLLGLPAFNTSDCIFDNQVCYEFHILDLFIDNTFTLLQNFTLTPKPKIELQFSNGLPAVQFDAGTSVNLTMPTVGAGATANDLTIAPTFTMKADVRNQSNLKIGAGLFFNPLYGHLEVHISTDVGDVNFDEDIGFSDIELISGDLDVSLIDKTFEMKGFNAISKSPFTVEGFRYPTATLASVSPVCVALNSGALLLTVTGADFVDAYTNMAGTIPGSVVRWDGNDRTTTFVNSTSVTANIPASDIAVEGTHMVTVFNPPPGGGASNAIPVIVDGTPPVITGTANPAALERTGNPNILVSVTITGSITDAGCGVDPTSATFTVDDEYNLIEPSGSITLNPNGTYQFVVRLAPRREPKDSDGRLYQVKIQAKDELGFTGTHTVNVIVPRG